MKKVEIETKVNKKQQDYIEKHHDAVLKDPEIKKLINDNKISAEEIDNNLGLFLKYFDDRKGCQNCVSLQNCSHAKNGIKTDIQICNQKLVFKNVYCPKYYQDEEHNKFLNNYLERSFGKFYVGLTSNNIGEQKFVTENLITESITILKWYTDNDSNNLFIEGEDGSGKTLLSAILSNYCAKKGKTVAFYDVPMVCQTVRTVNTYSDEYRKIVNDLREADVLVLDNLMYERPSIEFRDGILMAALTYRNANAKKTIFTGINHKQLNHFYDITEYGDKDIQKGNSIANLIMNDCTVIGLKK